MKYRRALALGASCLLVLFSGCGGRRSAAPGTDAGPAPIPSEPMEQAENVYFDAAVIETYEGAVLAECLSSGTGGITSGEQVVIPLTAGMPALKNGDSIRVVHNGMVRETAPLQLGEVYGICHLGEHPGEGTFPHHHSPGRGHGPGHGGAAYCGNTVTTVSFHPMGSREDERWTASFWGADSAALTDLLRRLDYSGGLCRCLPEYTVDTEFGSGYGISLAEGYVRYGDGQSDLTAGQLEKAQAILERAALLA